jgi:hypothetical protein
MRANWVYATYSKAACANLANRIRVIAQLVEAEAGKHVGAERYDRDLADIFALRDEITEAVKIAIAWPLLTPNSTAPCANRPEISMQDRGSRALRACHGNDNARAMKPKLAKSHAAATAACHCAVASARNFFSVDREMRCR